MVVVTSDSFLLYPKVIQILKKWTQKRIEGTKIRQGRLEIESIGVEPPTPHPPCRDKISPNEEKGEMGLKKEWRFVKMAKNVVTKNGQKRRACILTVFYNTKELRITWYKLEKAYKNGVCEGKNVYYDW